MPPGPTATFSDLVQLLESQQELTRVRAAVSADLEIAAICERVCRMPARGHLEPDRSEPARLGGRALLFENVSGSEFPVAINTFGSYSRVNLALGTANLSA